MKHLFETDQRQNLTIAPQVYFIKEFAELKDKRDPAVFMREMAVIYFFADMRSPFHRFAEIDRLAEIKKDILYQYPDWQPDALFHAAVAKYKELSFTPLMLTLAAAKKGMSAIENYLNTVDLDERTDKGALVHNATAIKTAIKDLPSLAKSYKELEMIVLSDINENNLLQAGREKSPFEDPDDHMG